LPKDGDETSGAVGAIVLHRKKLGRLVACYLVFMNSARSALTSNAREFGIELGSPTSANPLRFSAIYMIALAAAVYVGVFFSAAAFDIFNGANLLSAVQVQNTSDVQRWVIMAGGCYGVPILGVLLLRNLVWRMSPASTHSIAATYAWIVMLGAVLSTLGLTLAILIAGRSAGQWAAFFDIAARALQWSIGPALICVYVNHYLDRQIDPRLPDIGEKNEPPALRALYAIRSTFLVMVLTLPSVPSVHARPDAIWTEGKLRVVTIGTVFSITLAVSLVAQFALWKNTSSAAKTVRVRAQA
jgi:hypothetical protein